MQVPLHLAMLRRRCWLYIPLLVVFAAIPSHARGPEPALRIPLPPLGFQPLIPEFLLNGGSMLTLHFVDDTHLLLTFNARTLLKRIPDDPPEDQDRNVAALLLELPSGRVLARTEWRFHDHGQYLWPLGHGRFLLRTRNTLTTIAPLANLATSEPFRQRPFLATLDRHIGVLLFTPEADMLIVESKPKEAATKPAPPARPPLFGPAPHPAPAPDSTEAGSSSPVQINFYRISIPPGPGDEVTVRSAGVGRSRTFGQLPLTTAGHLEIIDQGHQSWAFNFDTFTGKTTELPAFDSTCRPFPVFVSHSEFIAFGCRGGQTPKIMGAFNMRGEEMWQQGLFGDYIAPHFAFAPASGRFAFGRVMASSTILNTDSLQADQLTAQTVVVYQTHSGDQLLKIDCSPIERAGQNFDLSPSGLNFGVVRANAIEIYKLPSLTKKQKTAVELAQASAPEEVEVPVRVSNQPLHEEAAATPTAAEQAPASPDTPPATQPTPAAAAPAATAPAQPSIQPAPQPAPAAPPATVTASGDPQTDQPRKPPTLYTLPTDPPHNQPNDQPK